MGRTCGEPDEIKKNTHPKKFTLFFASRTLRPVHTTTPPTTPPTAMKPNTEPSTEPEHVGKQRRKQAVEEGCY